MATQKLKSIKQPSDNSDAIKAYDYLLNLSRVGVGFARVRRLPRYSDGVNESDAEHSYHLALSATELAATYFPELDAGLVAQFSLVHDLPELYAGDTSTYNITNEDRQKKERAEKDALKRLLSELPPHTAQLLERYEKQEETEARFVRFVDKVIPELILIASDTARFFKQDRNITSPASHRAVRLDQAARLQTLFPDFPFVQKIWELTIKKADAEIFPEEKGE